ncbi:MAG: AAA family ATPase [Planctomycetes bacterium]|nr:AAA family ATPase [Planctomycetota bacterium]
MGSSLVPGGQDASVISDPLLSQFRSATDPNVLADAPLSVIIDRIRSPELADRCADIRRVFVAAGGGAAGKDAIREMKKALPAVTIAGTFFRRTKTAWRESSGLVGIDLDDLTEDRLAMAWQVLTASPWVAFLYRSPSGSGLKGAITVAGLTIPNAEHYDVAWHGVSLWIASLGFENDPAVKDVSRLSFLAHDPAAYWNPASIPFDLDRWQPSAPADPQPPEAPGRQRPGDDFNRRCDLADLLQRHGWSLDRDGENQHWRRPGKTSGTSATLKERVFYVFSSNAPPFESNKAYSAFAVFALLEHRGDFATAASALRAAGYGEQPSSTISNERNTDAPASGVVTLTPEDLLAYETDDDPNTLLGRRWLCRAGACLVVGQTGIGKSSFCMQAAITWALGLPVFGIAPTRPLRSLIIQAENDAGDLAEMFRGVMSGIGCEDALPELQPRLRFVSDTATTSHAFHVLARTLIAEHQPDLVWIDPLFAFLGGNASDQEVISTFLRNGLGAIAQDTGATWMVMHHTNKPAKDAKTTGVSGDYAYLGSGSAELANWARAVLVLREVEDDLYELRAAKRGRRSGMVDGDGNPCSEIFLQHGAQGICWRRAEPAQDEQLDLDRMTVLDVVDAMDRDRDYTQRDLREVVMKVTGLKRGSMTTKEKRGYRLLKLVVERTRVPNQKDCHRATTCH